ncbi:MAG: GNAT family N-acetyltransferase [Alphaproteobacteria bacterium]|nr:GNAT family N-acetyltransferase [Alphaproteobacteria bacterium]
MQTAFAHEAPILTTDRLLLRAWRDDDIDGLTDMMADAEVAQFLTIDRRPPDRATTWRSMAAFIGHWQLRGYGLFVVEERATGAFVGRVGPWRPEGWPGFEIGWGLARAHWGKGYAAEAARVAGEWAFETFALDAVISLIHVDNVRSQNVAMRLGERPGAATLHAGQPHVIWRATRSEWGRPRV